jgi:HrpA-like RNA helicase
VKLEWLREAFPQHLSESIEHVYDRTHKRVAAIRLIRFRDLVLAKEHQREVDPAGSGAALARAYSEGVFELPLLTHDLKQFISRVNLIARALPELEFPPFDSAALERALAGAFRGMTLAKEAQAAELKPAVYGHLAAEQVGWLDELAPTAIAWPGTKKMKLLYPETPGTDPPELQVKLHECFDAKEHPRICEGKVAVRVFLCSPDGKRLQRTTDWPQFRANEYPKVKSALQKKFPGFTWR